MARDTKKIDSKGRFYLPSRVKDKLTGDLVVTNSFDKNYLTVYRLEDYMKIEEQLLNNSNYFEHAVRMLQRRIIGGRVDTKIDGQSRLTVPDELWENIGAVRGDEICVYDMGSRLEICTVNTYKNEQYDSEALDEMASKQYMTSPTWEN